MTTTSAARTVLATAGFLVVAAFFLTTEHRAHAFGLLPYLLVLACPLLHLFGHGGHGGHGGQGGHVGAPRGSRASPYDAQAGRTREPEDMP